jgi:hypothetical protein
VPGGPPASLRGRPCRSPPNFQLSCPSDSTCCTFGQVAAGSQIVMQLAVTNDGGSWSSVALPAEIGVLANFSWASAGTCAVLGPGLAGNPVSVRPPTGARHGPGTPDPRGQYEHDGQTARRAGDRHLVLCQHPMLGIGANRCTRFGKRRRGQRGLLALLAGQGQSWQPAQLPDGVRAIVSVSCPNTNTCYAFSLVAPHTGKAVFGLLTNSSS